MHRDLKLENLLLATPNDIHKVKIADFGLAKKAAESAMATICGTPQYVAPEVIQVPFCFYLPCLLGGWLAWLLACLQFDMFILSTVWGVRRRCGLTCVHNISYLY